MSNPRPHERVFDLDDVRALGAAFTPEELAWVTLPAAWKQGAPVARVDDEGFAALSFFEQSRALWHHDEQRGVQQTYTNRVLHQVLNPDRWDHRCNLNSDALRALDLRFDAFVRERTGRRPVDPTFLFTGLEASWIHRCGVFETLSDPMWRAIVANNRGRDGAVVAPDGTHVPTMDLDDDAGTSELRAIPHIERPTGSLPRENIDHDAIEIMARVLDAQAQVLREAAEQAMADQNDPPVRRARARL
ncbi:hypothetical protein [Burkholderia anthina]|uniref:hypothetical protein n=1 Tax=Burkholderia anthina TaxID=179879 RepID=UPI0037BFDADD